MRFVQYTVTGSERSPPTGAFQEMFSFRLGNFRYSDNDDLRKVVKQWFQIFSSLARPGQEQPIFTRDCASILRSL